MHLRLLFLAAAWVSACSLAAQELETSVAQEPVEDRWTDQELDDLLAPIALHPDALIALILPASTNPSDVVLAARRLAANPDPMLLDQEPWDDSVRGLARYPEIVKWMDENLAWTKEVGQAFAAQPADVMNAIQRLRGLARAAGTLQDSPQQQVVIEEEEIRIVPARSDVIYVPRYDPTIVYVSRPVYYPSSFITFGIGYPVGYWLAYDCDWRYRTVWIVPTPHRVRVWHERRHWHHPSFHQRHRDERWHAWRPRPNYPRPGGGDGFRHRRYSERDGIVSRSRPGSPSWPRDAYRESDERRERGDEQRDFQRDRQVRRDRDGQGRREQTPEIDGQRQRQWQRERDRLSGGSATPGQDWRRRDRADDSSGSGWREQRADRQRGTEQRVPGQRRVDRVQAPSPLPGGETPSVSPPVGPAASVAPTTSSPAAVASQPRVSPSGRRLPGHEQPREFVRSPTGRYMTAPSTPQAPRVAAPPPRVEQPRVMASAPPRESMRPQMQRTEAPRQLRHDAAPRSEASVRQYGGPRNSDNGRSQTERHQD